MVGEYISHSPAVCVQVRLAPDPACAQARRVESINLVRVGRGHWGEFRPPFAAGSVATGEGVFTAAWCLGERQVPPARWPGSARLRGPALRGRSGRRNQDQRIEIVGEQHIQLIGAQVDGRTGDARAAVVGELRQAEKGGAETDIDQW